MIRSWVRAVIIALVSAAIARTCTRADHPAASDQSAGSTTAAPARYAARYAAREMARRGFDHAGASQHGQDTRSRDIRVTPRTSMRRTTRSTCFRERTNASSSSATRQTIVSDSGIYYAQATKRVTTGGNYILSSPGTGQADISGHGQGAYDLRDRSARVTNVRLPVNNGVMWYMSFGVAQVNLDSLRGRVTDGLWRGRLTHELRRLHSRLPLRVQGSKACRQ